MVRKVLLICGILAGMNGTRIAANQPTPLLGVWERINIFGYMLWIVILAILLLRKEEVNSEQLQIPINLLS